jgi:hypothetical protein
MIFRRFMQRGINTANVKGVNKVAVLGAAGGIGQPLSLLLKDLPGTCPYNSKVPVSNWKVSKDTHFSGCNS